MRKPITKKPDREKFYRIAINTIREFGGTPAEPNRDDCRNEFNIETLAGTARVIVSKLDVMDSKAPPDIYSRFSEPERASQKWGDWNVSRISGKWNHHFPDGFTTAEAEEVLRLWLEKITGKVPATA